MKERSSYKSIWFELGALLALLASATLWIPAPQTTAQQDNRQLKREQTQPKGAEQRRIALVMGNGAYQNVKPLKNPPNDATLLAVTLKSLGFEVTIGTDKSQREMKQLIREFGQRLRGGGGVGLFYFAGHGVQARGHNYLIPVDAEIQTEADLEDVALDVNYVLNMMDDAQNALNIAILDACRNNPFARSFRSAQEGLAQVKAPTGTLIAYATAPDSVAADGGGTNSPYAEELTKQIQVSGVLVETMFRRVAEEVSLRSGGRQEPWYSANVKGDFYFSGSPKSSLSNTPVKVDAIAVEREYWETIRNSNDTQDYKDYLQSYPNGTYVAIARSKIKQLERSSRSRLLAGSPPLSSQPANTSRSKVSRARVRANKTHAPSTVSLWIVSKPPNCRLYVDDKALGDTGAAGEVELRLTPGTHRVRLSREGFVSIEADVEVGSTPEAQEVEFTLTSAKTSVAAPKSFRNHQGIEMVYIPPGSFMMGGNNHTFEEPVHEVKINQSFYMGKYEVTQAQWQAVMGKNDSYFKGDNLPVETVSWDDAIAFVARLNAQNDGYFYRLPTEAEWEYACRAGTTTAFAFGDSISSDQSNFDGSDPEYVSGKGVSRKKTVSVGSFQANAFGLHDMHGNVWEWCQDWYHDDYNGAPSDGSAWLMGGEQKYRVARGGSWLIKASISRSAIRYWASPDYRDMNMGFRIVAVARTADSPPTNLQPSNSGRTETNEPVSAAKTNASPPKSFKSQYGIEMVYIPAGRFMMGSNAGESNEKPVHEVTISRPFYMGKYEVTQGQWLAVMGNNPSIFRDCGANCPVEQVSWVDVQTFVNKLNKNNDGFRYRLPTEAEWEYACRAGSSGDHAPNPSDVAWYSDNSGGKPHAVGQKQPNAWGLFDMYGSVWEWCEDWYYYTYDGAPTDGGAQLNGEQASRVYRGGSWYAPASGLRSTIRSNALPGTRGGLIGFRLVAEMRTQ
jgi:formylglycine-generating enzyme required for sulfatase activity